MFSASNVSNRIQLGQVVASDLYFGHRLGVAAFTDGQWLEVLSVTILHVLLVLWNVAKPAVIIRRRY